MINNEMMGLGYKRSVIRDIFEFGNQRAKTIGRENILDFSLGNPNVPAPDAVTCSIKQIIQSDPVAVHGYTSAQGSEKCRTAISEDLNRRFGTNYSPDNLYLTCGAAASLSITLKALTCCSSDEFIIFSPYFPEYKLFIQNCAGAKCVEIPPRIDDFQINFEEFEKAVNQNTKGVIINSPNNPSGVVYSDDTISRLSNLLKAKSIEFGKPVYLISDEPYREIVFNGEKPPFIAPKYENTIVCYSFSKSLSMPGERIGYILVPDCVSDAKDVYAAVCGAGRAMGYVCAPALFQTVAAQCCGMTSDISVYDTNRRILYDALLSFGFTCVSPGGAFYLFPRTPEPDANGFCEKAKQHDLLLVPGDGFGAPGHVRIAYCVKTETILKSLPVFQQLAKEYGIY